MDVYFMVSGVHNLTIDHTFLQMENDDHCQSRSNMHSKEIQINIF